MRFFKHVTLTLISNHASSVGKMSNHPMCLLSQVVEAYESDWMSVGFNHYLMHVQSAGFEGGVLEGEATEDSPSVYLNAGHLMQLDTCLCTHGPCSQLQGQTTTFTPKIIIIITFIEEVL